MHEFSIASGIMDVVTKTAEENGISRVAKVKIRVGELRSVFPESLLFAFKICSEGTVADGGVLEIVEVPTRCACGTCGHEFRVEDLQFLCPSCGSNDLSIVAGEELLIESIEGE